MQAVRVACLEQTLLEEPSDTVRDHTVALHLSDSEPQTTVTTTTLDWLAREGLHRSPRARVLDRSHTP
jgi:hypothetical protein